MGAVTATEFEKNIKSQNVQNIYYIYGLDSGRVIKLAEAVRQKVLGKGYTAADYMKFDGDGFSLSEFLETAEMYPMFSEYNFIEINDLNADTLKSDELKKFISLLENIPEKTIILISITGFDIKGGKKTVGAKDKKILDTSS